MRIIIAATLALAFASTSAQAASTYTYQVGKSAGITMWVADFASSGHNSIADAVWEWESQNPGQALVLCQREWLANAKKGSLTTQRYSCRVLDK